MRCAKEANPQSTLLGEVGSHCEDEVPLRGEENCSKIGCVMVAHFWLLLKAIELNTMKGWTVWPVNYISIELLLNGGDRFRAPDINVVENRGCQLVGSSEFSFSRRYWLYGAKASQDLWLGILGRRNHRHSRRPLRIGLGLTSAVCTSEQSQAGCPHVFTLESHTHVGHFRLTSWPCVAFSVWPIPGWSSF